MKIFLDTSNVDEIRKRYYTGLIDGVTTNPTLMMKEGRDPRVVIEEICDIFAEDTASISAEVTGDTVEELLEEAEVYRAISRKVTIKLPCTVDGLLACKTLSDQNVPVNVTLIFSVSQAILAAKAGASYISPFVGRVDDQRFGGCNLIKRIADLYFAHHRVPQILSASIRSVGDVEHSFGQGADIVTMPVKVFDKMYDHILTDQGLDQFNKDWSQLTGK